MEIHHTYVVPDYYPSFTCKGSDCRSTCCHGWDISLAMPEYYRMIGLGCSQRLRSRIDGALHLADRPTFEKYAYFNRGFDGGCPLHDSNGLCMLQRECGEEPLSSVCRYFPRSPKARPYECSCACSCEKTLEMLTASDAPLGFVELPLTFKLEAEPLEGRHDETAYKTLRANCFSMLSDRSMPLTTRLIGIGTLCGGSEAASDPNLSYEVRRRLTESFMGASDSLYDFGSAALSSAADQSGYERMYAGFCKNYPKHEIWLEKILANHMFYEGFPFSGDPRVTPYDSYIALSGVYLLLSFLCAGCLHDKTDAASFIDLCASTFRLIDNSNFDIRATALLHESGIPKLEDVSALLK